MQTRSAFLLLLLLLILAGCGPSQPTPAPVAPTSTIPPTVAAALPANLTELSEPYPGQQAPEINAKRNVLISPDTVKQVELAGTLSGHTNKVLALAFSVNDIYIASDSLDRTIRLWNARSGQSVHTFVKSESEMIITNSIAFSPDGNLLASAEAIWDVKSGNIVHTLQRGQHAPVAFSPDESLLAVALFDQPIKLWGIDSGQVAHTFSVQPATSDEPVLNIVFSPDGALLATSGHLNGLVQLWDVATEQLVHTLSHNTKSNIHALAFSPDGRLLASAGTDYTVILWDVTSGQQVHSLRHRDGLWSIAFSPDGSLLASAGCDGRVQIWEVASGKLLHILEHSDQVTSVVFSPDGTLLVSGGYDNQVYVWGILANQ